MIEYQKERFKEVLQKTEAYKKFYEDNVKELRSIIDYMDKDISIKESDNVETIILKKYIECGSIKSVCDFINDKGYRITTNYSNRKYTKDDISQIVFPYKYERVINADEELKEVAKQISMYMGHSIYGALRVKEFKDFNK